MTVLTAQPDQRDPASAAETIPDRIERHIAVIEARNPALNAVIAKRFDQARAEAREAEARRLAGVPLGPLDGVPVTIKDSLDLAGFASTFGLPSRKGAVADADEPHVARLRAAGAIVLGKTNVAQMLLAHESDNPLFGRSSNPHDLSRTPGGSSGGEGAIIAAGGSRLGLGSDIAGSVRVPAAFCGIAALKPTAGRLPDRGRFSAHPGQQAVRSEVGVMAATVAEVAAGLEIVNGGPTPGRLPGAPLFDWRDVRLESLRVAWFDDDGILPASPALRRAVREAADSLARAGATVTRWRLPDPRRAADIFVSLLSADGAASLARVRGGDPLDPGLRPFYTLMRLPRGLLGALGRIGPLFGRDSLAEMVLPNIGHRDTLRFWDMVAARDAYADAFEAALDAASEGPFDIILSPPYPLPALPHGASGNFGFGGVYSVIWNLLGYPAGVVPMGRVRPGEETDRGPSPDRMHRAAAVAEAGSAGLPVGVQIAARPWREDHALAVMAHLEQSIPTRNGSSEPGGAVPR